MEIEDRQFMKELHDRHIYSLADLRACIVDRGEHKDDLGYIIDIFNKDYPTTKLLNNSWVGYDEYND